MSLPFVNLTLQQTKSDCAIAAYAMLTGITYGDALTAAVSVKRPKPHVGGMYTPDIRRMARKLGRVLELKRNYDLETDEGLLTVERITPKADEHLQHMVLLKWGLVFDTDGMVWEPETFLKTNGFKLMGLLVLVPSMQEDHA